MVLMRAFYDHGHLLDTFLYFTLVWLLLYQYILFPFYSHGQTIKKLHICLNRT